ncbi:ABC transporter permease [Agrobacterium rhizogenes]|uniref:Spermidine/putrescine ABC transporter n=1 Tax=Rhizobium rhizogenes (strain K84 / ATCC BAA-868) TaxID=311403 RepID=B9JGX8_RHIR8|nr:MULTISPECIES: ABC transporter permease [Rhizobium]ACM24974.1 spermidine/putrescine ABC transporter [Rhizobium rhizogenes K84]OCJ03858.1 spermidine/putrescine ABC transporter permease [Agrobacterium sp. 13-626]OCJ21349.1 spermidine/putrescine ABC transporter permease [Agrobacterium sp. B131/95]OCJ29427.1 spermidine/putrescine ABC transporter permease [Agrobacterium sp. B133/95]EJK78534.1 ABC-type spermidine/putrescine transport system, permease component I [Rhizobium sp. AP16]
MKHLAKWGLAAPAMVAVVLFLVVPVVITIAATFMEPKGVFSPYVAFFNSGFRRTVLYRTIEIALITTVISLLVGFIAAYVIAQMPGRAKSVMIIAAVFPLLTGVVVRSFAWLIILGKNGILNTMLLSVGVISEPLSMLYTEGSVIVAMVYLFVPLMILTLVGVLEGIPQDLIQAATSLGATPAATFRQVILPLATPGLIVGAVLVFTGSFTSYATPQLLGGEKQMTMGTFLYQRAMVTFDWVGASTIAAIMVVVTIGIVLIMSRIARRLNPMAV